MRYSAHRPIYGAASRRRVGAVIASAGNAGGGDLPDPLPPPDPPPDDPGVFEYGVTKPTAANTGISTPTTSTNTSGSMSNGSRTLTLSSGTYDNVRFESNLNITGPVTLNECVIVGDPTNGAGTAQRSLVICTNASAVLSAYRCHAEPALPHRGYSACFFGHDMNLDRCDMSGAEDILGFVGASGATSADNNVVGCYLHDMVKWAPDWLGRAEGSHNDLIQHHGIAGHRGNNVMGCNLEATIDAGKGEPLLGNRIVSCMMFAPRGGGSVIVGDYTYNWMSDGEIGMNMGDWTGSGHIIHVDFNRFLEYTFDIADGGIIKASGFHFTGASSLTGNVNVDSLGAETPFTAGAFAGTWP